jgi:hypothetical protein
VCASRRSLGCLLVLAGAGAGFPMGPAKGLVTPWRKSVQKIRLSLKPLKRALASAFRSGAGFVLFGELLGYCPARSYYGPWVGAAWIDKGCDEARGFWTPGMLD